LHTPNASEAGTGPSTLTVTVVVSLLIAMTLAPRR
jgi:hypothetical protein